MSEQLALGLTALAMLIAYIYANVRLAESIADRLDRWFAPRDRPPRIDEDTGIAVEYDDEVVDYERVETGMLSNAEFRPVSRGDARWHSWKVAVAFPLVGYLNYRFFDQVAAGFEVSFQYIAGLIIATFYGG